MRIIQKVDAAIMRNLRHIIFYVRTKTSVDFQICIRVPLNVLTTSRRKLLFTHNVFNEWPLSILWSAKYVNVFPLIIFTD